MKKENKLTITWDTPNLQKWDEVRVSGLDFLTRIKDDVISQPPAGMLLGYKISELRHGYAAYELVPGEHHYNPFGTVHGGILSTLLDTTMTSAIITTLGKDYKCSTSDIKINLIKSVTVDTGVLRCEAKPVHVGRKLAIAEGRILDKDNNLYAHGVSSCFISKKLKNSGDKN